ncbi:MAG: segregation and condensation protein A [Planctomycetota bacterium]
MSRQQVGDPLSAGLSQSGRHEASNDETCFDLQRQRVARAGADVLRGKVVASPSLELGRDRPMQYLGQCVRFPANATPRSGLDEKEAATAVFEAPVECSDSNSGSIPTDIRSQPPVDMDFVPALDAYAGPLDLLLYLISKNEVDIFDIPIALILDQYLVHMRHLKTRGRLNLLDAGDFLVIAARLMEIKSRMMLPAQTNADDEEPLEEEFLDPRRSLVHQLLEYRETKERASLLELAYEGRSKCFGRMPGGETEPPDATLDLRELSIWDLATALARVLALAHSRDRIAVIEIDDPPIESLIAEIRGRLDSAATHEIAFGELFRPELGRRVLIGYFLACLEMAKSGWLRLIQSENFGTIYLGVRARAA